jgi:reactive intermediate/imine deaminase
MPEMIFHDIRSAPAAFAPFCHAVEVDGWVQLTGQMPIDPGQDSAGHDLKPLPSDVGAQTHQVMANLRSILNEIGLGLEHIMSARVYLTNFERDYSAMNDVYRSYFPEDRLPARTCVGVTAMAFGALVEIDVMARRG